MAGDARIEVIIEGSGPLLVMLAPRAPQLLHPPRPVRRGYDAVVRAVSRYKVIVGDTMLRLEPARGKRRGLLSNADAYNIFCDDEDAIGRIDLVGEGESENDALITMRDQTFEGRIYITGKGRWAHVPSRWVLNAQGNELHAATWESAKTWLTAAEPATEALLLRRGSFNPTITVEHAANKNMVAGIRWRRAQIVPKRVGQRLAIESTIELSETFQLFLLWVVVMDDYRNKGS
jgi:hypothetical protein